MLVKDVSTGTLAFAQAIFNEVDIGRHLEDEDPTKQGSDFCPQMFRAIQRDRLTSLLKSFRVAAPTIRGMRVWPQVSMRRSCLAGDIIT